MSETPIGRKEGALAQKVETAFTLLLPIFSVFFIWQATEVTEPPSNIVVGPRTFPLLIGCMMLAASAVLVWQRWRALAPRAQGAAPEAQSEVVPSLSIAEMHDDAQPSSPTLPALTPDPSPEGRGEAIVSLLPSGEGSGMREGEGRFEAQMNCDPFVQNSIEQDETAISDWPAVWSVLGSLLALFLLLEPLGFVAALALFLFGLSTLFAPRQWLLNLGIAIGFSTFFYYVFTRILEIPLPNGVLRSLF